MTVLCLQRNLLRFRWYSALNQHSRQYCTTGPNAFTPSTEGSFVIQVRLLEKCLRSHIPASVMTGAITTEPILQKPQRLLWKQSRSPCSVPTFFYKKVGRLKITISPYLLFAEVWGLHQDVNELLSLCLPPTCSLLLSLYPFISLYIPSSLLSLSPNPLHRLHLPSVHVDDVSGIAIACH